MNPDNQLIEDLKLGCLITLIAFPLFYIMFRFGGYAPADECANIVKDSMSYIKKQYLINDEPTYKNIRSWCEGNLDDWRPKLKKAMDYEEPTHENYHY